MLSLKWFREILQTEKEKELQNLSIENAKLNNKILKEQLKDKAGLTKPYKKVKLVNDVLTIVLQDGNVLSKANATQADFIKARDAQNENDLLKIVSLEDALQKSRKKEQEIAKIKTVIKGIEILKNTEDFVVKEDNTVYLKGSDGDVIERSLPQLLVEKFAAIVAENQLVAGNDSEYQALKKFWLKCCANPNAQSAEDLYDFLNNHQFKIDKHGNFYAYRRVVSKNGQNNTLVKFVSNTYTKVKSVWKKKPKDYFVYESDGSYSFSKDKHKGHIGNLEDLYLDLPNMQKEQYTDAHTRSFDYKVGEIVSMPRDKGDDNNNVSCSKGFHAASKAYDYSDFGDTPILLIINPMDVLAVPVGEVGKLRTCRWFFAAVLSEEEQHILDNEDFDVSELGDIFEEKCMANLQGYIQNSFAEEVKRHTFTLPQITGEQLTTIVASLEDMRNAIKDRVVDSDDKSYFD